VISSAPAFQTLVQSLSLDIGEQAALTLLESHPQSIFLTDDAAARLAAMTLGYRVHGTIGILIRAIRRQQRSTDEVIAILRTLPVQSTLFIRPKLLQDIIDKLENL
jgi:predicted nucleic acid-binding protein